MTINPIAGKTLLITGGTGSFGRNELRQYEMANLLQLAPHARCLRFFPGDVRGTNRLQRASELKTLVQQEIQWAD